MKLKVIVSTVLLLGQVNVCLAVTARVTGIDVNKTVTRFLQNAPGKDLDTIAKEIASGKKSAGQDLVNALGPSLPGHAKRLGLTNIEPVVAAMPRTIKVLAFMGIVSGKNATQSADQADIAFSNLLRGFIDKLSSKMTTDAGSELMALDNLFDNVDGLREELTPFLKDINGRMESGKSYKVSFRESAHELMEKYNQRNPKNKISSLDEYIKKIKECMGLT
ncbi:MAG: hypothetical protein JNM39_01615 [Bdellovibrionaceae bacterium]|nr:hypothetical protein [Pseudobdellovibrionaceae bacterium]